MKQVISINNNKKKCVTSAPRGGVSERTSGRKHGPWKSYEKIEVLIIKSIQTTKKIKKEKEKQTKKG